MKKYIVGICAFVLMMLGALFSTTNVSAAENNSYALFEYEEIYDGEVRYSDTALWKKENPEGNYYNDYFESFFKESFKKIPQYQRECGDFIEWNNPKTNNKLVMITSGFGDGFYQSYWGYDSEKEICELIIPLINPDLFGL